MRTGWSFIIVAAGQGTRLGGVPKQLRQLRGEPLWTWSARCAQVLFDEGFVEELVLVVPAKMTDAFDLGGFTIPAAIVVGGETRAESVRVGLETARYPFVLVHDAARPFVTPNLCRSLMNSTGKDEGAVPLCPVNDALKKKVALDLSVIDRHDIHVTQTPQCFPREALLKALRRPGTFLDEGEAWLGAGKKLRMVEGDRLNFKITDAADWRLAEALVREEREIRTGHGFDVHPLVPSRPLILGGLVIESPLGLSGHSDADIICHALSDALLGAVGLPDLGTLYPASQERYRGADSYSLLADVIRRVDQEGWHLLWADITLQAQVPRLAGWISPIVDKLSELIGLDPCGRRRVNLKVKSGEKVGPVGSASCMECHALATVQRGG
ncbi:MAG: 2-C-methyl-D-erythritol 2,4-cyclodiphosphate synthase [Synergistaceae bacterium]|nr:2-C-methyl-D-erythritol 2,4-cyclodiphosphate synthase [Synergistaceae bacterium]